MSGKPIKNHIVFTFNDEIDHDGKFKQPNDLIHLISGDFADSAAQPRWATVVSAGPNTDPDVSPPGTQILIENLKWTMGFKIDDKTFWRTDDTFVLAVAD